MNGQTSRGPSRHDKASARRVHKSAAGVLGLVIQRYDHCLVRRIRVKFDAFRILSRFSPSEFYHGAFAPEMREKTHYRISAKYDLELAHVNCCDQVMRLALHYVMLIHKLHQLPPLLSVKQHALRLTDRLLRG
jgi:hypothetical protein